MTQNLHLEHIEDGILTGDENVIQWLFCNDSTTSVKMDGAPAIVWGTNPENDKFFVGTKSVFNKKKIKICYTQNDIETLYSEQEELIEILSNCLDYLPRTSGVFQGDFIGFSGFQIYQANTITYTFNRVIGEDIIIAPHTYYNGDRMVDMVASPLHGELCSTDRCLFVKPMVDMLPFNRSVHAEDILDFYYNQKVNFLSEKEAMEAKKVINQFIREGKEISFDMLELILGDYNLACLYRCIEMMKIQMISSMKVYNGPKASINGEEIIAEGFVRSNVYGTFKLVNRYEFSVANFVGGKFQK